jgi:hypothetical protein
MTKRLVSISISFLILAVGWFFLSSPISVSAIDVTPTPTNEIEDPVFPATTPEPEVDAPPALYGIPLALNPHDHFYFTRPIAIDSNTDPLPDFRYGYFYTNDDTVHTGVDITSPLHKPILAAADGQVIFTGYGLLTGSGDVDDPYGLAVLIKHSFSFGNKTLYTVYAHMDRIDVKKGQMVNAGDQVGIIGMTGNTTGPHLHFEVRVEDEESGRVQNPELWLVPPVGSGVLAGRIKNDFGYFISAQPLSIKSLETEKTYQVISYAPVKNVYSDDFFNENFVIGDIPAGLYQISMLYKGKWYRYEITISPGTVNFVFFNGKKGFSQEYPPAPDPSDFVN